MATGVEALSGIANGWQSSLSQINSGLAGLGVDSEAIQYGAAATQVLAGTVTMAKAYLGAFKGTKAKAVAEASVQVAKASAIGPYGWAKIALATGTAVAVGAFVGATLKKTIRKDLSTASGRQSAAQEALA